jgi:hypothetical protein
MQTIDRIPMMPPARSPLVGFLRALVLALPIFLSVGCVSTQRSLVMAENNPDSNRIFLRDVPYLHSTKEHTVVVGIVNPVLTSNLSDLPSLYLLVRNGGTSVVEVGLENIEVISADKQVKLYSQREIIAALEKAARRRQMGLAIAAGMQQIGASMQANAAQYSQTYGTANVYSPNYGSTNVSYSSYTTTYNPAASAAAQTMATAAINSQMQSNMALVDIQKQRAIGANRNIFGKTTLAPGDFIDGRLIFDGKAVSDGGLRVRVTIDSEEHVFFLKTETTRL